MKLKKSFKKIILFGLILLVGMLTIILVKPFFQKAFQTNVDACKKITSSSLKEQCWQKEIRSSLQSKGIDGAFETLSDLYDSDPKFSGSCHGLVHDLGEEAFKLFLTNKKFNFSKKSNICSFGFYHAYMQELVRHNGNDYEKAREFCLEAERQLQTTTPDILGACFHGIGHGLIDDDGFTKWNSEEEMVAPALKFCDNVAEDDSSLRYRCGSGVFNAMALAYIGERAKVNNEDPIWYCKQIKDEVFRNACLDEMNTFLLSFTKGDLTQASQYLAEINNDEEAKSATRSLAQYYTSFWKEDNYASLAASCRTIQQRLINSCIFGLAAGLVENSTPGNENIKSLKLCNISDLQQTERTACFSGLQWYLGRLFPPEKAKSLCNTEGNKFKNYCVPKDLSEYI